MSVFCELAARPHTGVHLPSELAPFFLRQTVEYRAQFQLCCAGDLRLHLPKVVSIQMCSSFTANKPFVVLAWGTL